MHSRGTSAKSLIASCSEPFSGMPRRLKFLFVFVASLALGYASMAAPVSHEPANLDLPKQEIRTYVESGQYDRDIAAVVAETGVWLDQRAKQGGSHLAVVFDLDETLLSNWPFMADQDLGGSDAAWEAWMARGKAPPIEPVRALYLRARKLGFDVYFLTTRKEHLRPATEQNLRAIACGDYVALIMEPESWAGTGAAFKSAERYRLSASGHVIIANIGDQKSDLAGGFAERTFKLPDPFYITK